MPGFAGDTDVTLGGVNQIKNPNYKELSKAFIDVSKAVSDGRLDQCYEGIGIRFW